MCVCVCVCVRGSVGSVSLIVTLYMPDTVWKADPLARFPPEKEHKTFAVDAFLAMRSISAGPPSGDVYSGY